MKLVRGAWKLLVGIKDALVLIVMLLFFGALFAALSARPNAGAIKDGALVLALNGTIVEQPSETDPLALAGGGDAMREYRLRDLVRAIDASKDDGRVKAVVLDLDRFAGAYPAALSEVGAALGRVRASGKPVLAYATVYTDGGYLLAAHASEIWMNPMGGTLFMGPGGSRLYYKGLIDKLGVNVHVYRVGQFKAAVEPFTRADQSPEAREAGQALYGALFAQWRENVAKARPEAQVAAFLAQPDRLVTATNGDIAEANRKGGLIDRLGDRVAFGKRVAAIVGVDPGKPAGSFKTIKLANWIAANPMKTGGDAIGVLTVAGDIVDGKGGNGMAGGDTVSRLLLKGLAEKKLKALVLRVDSPGGSVLASEQIRQAVLQAKAQGLPVVVSMGNMAASGGYWISTPADAIFAEPNTITGSIGIFGLIPTFENALPKIGLSADGVATTPLTGQPDIYRGTSPTMDAIIQASVENGYRRFIGLVAASRKMTPAAVDRIAQGRVWDGGTARQLGLVDRFGTLQDAVDEAARRAKLDPKKAHAAYLEKEPGFLQRMVMTLTEGEEEDAAEQGGGDVVARVAIDRQAILAQAVGDARRMMTAASMQVRCLECAGAGPARPSAGDVKLLEYLMARVGL